MKIKDFIVFLMAAFTLSISSATAQEENGFKKFNVVEDFSDCLTLKNVE